MSLTQRIRPGISFEVTREVTADLSASHLGSGSVGVLATPAMILLMESAARQAVQPFLEAGATTVGYVVNVMHLKPTPVGASVTARAEVTASDGRKITFRVEAREGDKLVGEGEHVRVVVDEGRFLASS
jgi:predicted thioesterase